MKRIKTTGLFLFLIALSIFSSLLFIGKYELSESTFTNFIENKGIKSELFIANMEQTVVGNEFSSQFAMSSAIIHSLEEANIAHKTNQEWDKVIWDKPHNLSYELIKPSGKGIVYENKTLFWLLTFGLGIIGALLFILPNVILLGGPGIKNNGIYHSTATNRGWIGILAFIYLVGFYVLLYFNADYVVNWTYIVDPMSLSLSGNLASQWFLYGFLYCTAMTVMAVRMYIKYRNNKYQIVRTTSVLFFQIGFAFLIPEILVRFNQPYYDFKNAFPLDYDFFFDWNLNNLIASGNMGIFILVWGLALTLIIVPVLVYFYGKRWYCSWVCGCGGLAETLGDPYRQLSSKKLVAWKIERWLVHGVLVFALLMTVFSLYSYFSGADSLLGIKTKEVEYYYGFLIGSIFAGVIGTGFYPILGNRVWCRFGCPLAAYLGLVQRFKSRFRITTNGGQCISCGNCSTYCEQGIDVRAYAQKGENIIRASCVGCGVCAAVCPRGVLKLENGPEEGRIKSVDIPLGNDIDLIKMMNDRKNAS
tara:strand:- start:57958 stop:59550 length:1593 start_codon:yes stop_codon:yes gene_type:complete